MGMTEPWRTFLGTVAARYIHSHGVARRVGNATLRALLDHTISCTIAHVGDPAPAESIPSAERPQTRLAFFRDFIANRDNPQAIGLLFRASSSELVNAVTYAVCEYLRVTPRRDIVDETGRIGAALDMVGTILASIGQEDDESIAKGQLFLRHFCGFLHDTLQRQERALLSANNRNHPDFPAPHSYQSFGALHRETNKYGNRTDATKRIADYYRAGNIIHDRYMEAARRTGIGGIIDIVESFREDERRRIGSR